MSEEIKIELEYKEGIEGVGWNDNDSAKVPVYYWHKINNGKHNTWTSKYRSGEVCNSKVYDNFEPSPPFERALELAIEEFEGDVCIDTQKEFYLALAKKELLRCQKP